jgi:hypothetical protein
MVVFPRGFSLALHGGTPLVVSPWPSMVALPLWFLPDLPWWYSPCGFSLTFRGGTPLVVSLWPPWWYSCRGFSLALRGGTTYLALFVISGWPFLVLAGCSSWSLWSFLMVPPWLFPVVSPWLFLVVPPRGISLLSLMFLLFTYLLPSLLFSLVVQ